MWTLRVSGVCRGDATTFLTSLKTIQAHFGSSRGLNAFCYNLEHVSPFVTFYTLHALPFITND